MWAIVRPLDSGYHCFKLAAKTLNWIWAIPLGQLRKPDANAVPAGLTLSKLKRVGEFKKLYLACPVSSNSGNVILAPVVPIHTGMTSFEIAAS